MLFRGSKSLTLGVLGGGQLGMFLALEAKNWPIKLHLYLEKDQEAPARAHVHEVFIGQGWSDEAALLRFCESCDVIVLENEFVPVEILQKVPRPFVPNLEAYGIFQDKLKEKLLSQRTGVATGVFQSVSTLNEVCVCLETWGQLVLKTCRGGYDGTGNLTVTPETPAPRIEKFLSQGPCIAERWVEFAHEVAVMVARSETGEVVYPVAETIQELHICHQVLVPARFSPELLEEIQASALSIVREAKGVGLFGIEFFLTDKGELLYNETAPRPHNSAHFSIEGCTSSQFKSALEIALGLPLTAPELRSNCVAMLNLLGTPGGTARLEPAELFTAEKRGHLWLYGKKESRPGRKMGHYTLLADDPVVVLEKLTALQQRYIL